METITIIPEDSVTSEPLWRASYSGKHSIGKTAGEALDNLTESLSDSVSGAVVVVQPMQPDRFFTAEQRNRLQELMGKWRTARDTGGTLVNEEQAELEALVAAQLEGAAQRAEAMLAGVSK